MCSLRTVGIIVIGNELLNGSVIDVNSSIVSRAAPCLGLSVQKISIIPDDVKSIAREIDQFRSLYDIVITSGGIGPTHDDLTYAGIADALGETLFLFDELKQAVEKCFGGHRKALFNGMSLAKLSYAPSSAKFIYGVDVSTGRPSAYPIVRVKNMFVLPGIPEFFKISFEIIKEHLSDGHVGFYCRALYIDDEEESIAERLAGIAGKYIGIVNIGSYPTMNSMYYKVRLMLDSSNSAALDEAYRETLQMFNSAVISYEPDPFSCAEDRVYALSQSTDSLGQHVKSALNIIESAFERYSPSDLLIGFNGGKDCTALLHLVYAVSAAGRRMSANSSTAGPQPLCRLLCINSRTTFPELERFMHSTLDFYRLPHDWLLTYDGSIKHSLERLKSDRPEVAGVFMGTRQTDPRSGNLQAFSETDPGWPSLMRINPIIDWNYSTVWQFIRTLSLPYCCLYDAGYTSIGSPQDTHPNSNLRYVTEGGRVAYRPAHTLADQGQERSGRFV